MTRKYVFVWYPNKESKYNLQMITRHNEIILSEPTGITSIDAKQALNIFIGIFGSLKKNTVISIKEFDESGEQIGEDIVPASEENSIVPER